MECEDDLNCVKCETGKYLGDGACLSCRDACEECFANGTCFECEDGYKVEDGECVAFCIGEECVTCETGYYLTDLYQCAKCGGGYCGASLKKVLLSLILISLS